jgi:hypothetical protein
MKLTIEVNEELAQQLADFQDVLDNISEKSIPDMMAGMRPLAIKLHCAYKGAKKYSELMGRVEAG